MTKKAAKTTKSPKRAAKAAARRPAKKAAAKAAGRATAAAKARPKPVVVGVHGMARMIDAVRSAGLESAFNEQVTDSHLFVKMSPASAAKIRKFVLSQPGLVALAEEIKTPCRPGDPYCIEL